MAANQKNLLVFNARISTPALRAGIPVQVQVWTLLSATTTPVQGIPASPPTTTTHAGRN